MLGNKILSDGSDENDLKSVNIVSMQEFLGIASTDDTFESLFNATVEKVKGLLLQKEIDLLEQEKKERSNKRTQDTQQIVETLLTTIENLPLDAQVQITQALSDLSVKQADSTNETPHVTVKKAAKGKKAE